MNPVNYRPVALLNSVYKIIAKHANRELLAAAIEHSIIHLTQFGGLPYCRCQDHFFTSYPRFGNQLVATASTLISIRLSTPSPTPPSSQCCPA